MICRILKKIGFFVKIIGTQNDIRTTLEQRSNMTTHGFLVNHYRQISLKTQLDLDNVLSITIVNR